MVNKDETIGECIRAYITELYSRTCPSRDCLAMHRTKNPGRNDFEGEANRRIQFITPYKPKRSSGDYTECIRWQDGGHKMAADNMSTNGRIEFWESLFLIQVKLINNRRLYRMEFNPRNFFWFLLIASKNFPLSALYNKYRLFLISTRYALHFCNEGKLPPTYSKSFKNLFKKSFKLLINLKKVQGSLRTFGNIL